jgi:hypothetical protein
MPVDQTHLDGGLSLVEKLFSWIGDVDGHKVELGGATLVPAGVACGPRGPCHVLLTHFSILALFSIFAAYK